MSSHIHPPGTPVPAERDAFLIDGCPRCAEYVEDLGVSFDQDRFRAFWRKMVDVEYDDVGGYASLLDAKLGRRLYLVSLALHRAFGVNPQDQLGRQKWSDGRLSGPGFAVALVVAVMYGFVVGGIVGAAAFWLVTA